MTKIATRDIVFQLFDQRAVDATRVCFFVTVLLYASAQWHWLLRPHGSLYVSKLFIASTLMHFFEYTFNVGGDSISQMVCGIIMNNVVDLSFDC